MEENQVATAALTPAVAKTKMNLALTTHNLVLQTLQTEADSVEKNEDHLEQMKGVIDKIKKAKKVVEDKHAEIKKPYLEGARSCDAAKNELTALFDGILSPLAKKYSDLCTAVQKRKADEEAKKKKEQEILQTIETTVVDFSTRIASCVTRQSLIDVERLINLEKGSTRAPKYGEFHAKAIARFDEVLIPAIRGQKEVVEQIAIVDKKIQQAQEAGDIENVESLTEEKQQATSVLTNNQLKVQEHAIFNDFAAPVEEKVSIIHPAVPKGGRTDYEIEIVDIEAALKKSRHLLNIELKLADAKDFARDLDKTDNFSSRDSVIFNGIKYTKTKKF